MRKQIIIASIILVSILLIIILVARPKPTQNNIQRAPIPSTIEVKIDTNQQVIYNALSFTPYENEDFKFDYLSDINQFVVQEKTPFGQEKFLEWAEQNNLSELAGNPEFIVYEDQSGNQLSMTNNQSLESLNFNPIIEFLNIFLNFGSVIEIKQSPITSNQSLTNQDFISPQSSNPQYPSSSFVYYAQCNSKYADLPLPDGCNMCQAGCGAATVSMIASSYLGSNFDPKTIVNMYKLRGYLLSCAGSRYADARSLLQSLGLKTTDYIVFDYETADQVSEILKKYLSSGWTFFTLANFKENGGGHYFWITDIDNKGNIWAYDPYYGRFEAPPINENSRYPFPKYRLAFGVKR